MNSVKSLIHVQIVDDLGYILDPTSWSGVSQGICSQEILSIQDIQYPREVSFWCVQKEIHNILNIQYPWEVYLRQIVGIDTNQIDSEKSNFTSNSKDNPRYP